MIVYCDMRTWAGSLAVPYAVHYYAKLVHGRVRKELSHVLTAAEACALTESDVNDAPPYETGDTSCRFLSEDRLKKAALAIYKDTFPNATILVYGEKCVCDPQLLLDGPPELMAAVNELYDEAERNDWWEGDEEIMEGIYNRFSAIWEGVDP